MGKIWDILEADTSEAVELGRMLQDNLKFWRKGYGEGHKQ